MYAACLQRSCISHLNSRSRYPRSAARMQIAASLPHRKFTAVWSRLVRLTHAGNNKGPWSAAEDSQLMEAHGRLGPKWKVIGEMVGRLPESCRDRWRLLGVVPGKSTGRWGAEEEAALSAAVSAYDQEAGLVRSRPVRVIAPGRRAAACSSAAACSCVAAHWAGVSALQLLHLLLDKILSPRCARKICMGTSTPT
jgi:Myb-like DNA-binding domain